MSRFAHKKTPDPHILYIDGPSGFIAKANDPADFSFYVQTLASNPVLRKDMAKNAITFAQKFDWDHINTGLISCNQNLIEEYSIHQLPGGFITCITRRFWIV